MFRVNVQNLSKSYRMYAKPHDRFLEALLRRPRHSVFKALQDISFQVEIGASMGIIGVNGAGKSTLLKLLAGTLSPTGGVIELNGRITALLELGAGFHPELTGRQNIHLNASLMGISSSDLRTKEADIISFAELEDFIDRPVRTYSSGMYLRLAFSIATTLDPDILIIDEALAVGDLTFKRKCVKRMKRIKAQGKTILFSSHSIHLVQELCEKAIWISNGKIKEIGDSTRVTGLYEEFCYHKKDRNVSEKSGQQTTGRDVSQGKECHILTFVATRPDGGELNPDYLNTDEPIVLTMELEMLSDKVQPNVGFAVMRSKNEFLGAAISFHDGVNCGIYSKGEKMKVRYMMPNIPVRMGNVFFSGFIGDETGLLAYDIKIIGPFTIDTGKGSGLMKLFGTWEIIDEL